MTFPTTIKQALKEVRYWTEMIQNNNKALKKWAAHQCFDGFAPKYKKLNQPKKPDFDKPWILPEHQDLE